MRILVTGADGFIGRGLCDAAARAHHEVVAVGRSVTGDLATFNGWPALLRNVDVVVHLAALAHSGIPDPERLSTVNVDATRRIGTAAAKLRVGLVFLSSVKVHGEESGEVPLVETSPLAPRDAYGNSKVAAEAVLRGIPGLGLTVLRPPLVYGPGVKANFLALMRAVARGWPLPFAGLANRRSLIYVGNLADAILCCLELAPAESRTYLVSDGAAVSTTQLCESLSAALRCRARLFRFPATLLEYVPPLRRLTRSLEVDDGAIRRELGWRPPYSFEEGLRATADWYLAQAR
jgi:nucleoside-diphosphate-sugar epimerase